MIDLVNSSRPKSVTGVTQRFVISPEEVKDLYKDKLPGEKEKTAAARSPSRPVSSFGGKRTHADFMNDTHKSLMQFQSGVDKAGKKRKYK